MLRIFPNNHTKCCICNTPLSGENLLRRGDLFYCEVDFERTTAQEAIENAKIERELRIYKSIVERSS